jgi:hypothetical protein
VRQVRKALQQLVELGFDRGELVLERSDLLAQRLHLVAQGGRVAAAFHQIADRLRSLVAMPLQPFDLRDERASLPVERAQRVDGSGLTAFGEAASISSGWFSNDLDVEHRGLVVDGVSLMKAGHSSKARVLSSASAMDKLRITGGPAPQGRVPVAGAKNAALPALAATLLTEDKVELSEPSPCARCAHDAARARAARRHGRRPRRRTAAIQVARLQSFEAPYDLVRTMRASVLVLGPLVARYGRAARIASGGCAIGERPINLHIDGLHKMGATIAIQHGYVEASRLGIRGRRSRSRRKP